MENHEREQEIGMYLAQRAYAYSLMHVVFGSEPSAETVAKLLGDEAMEMLEGVSCELAKPVYAQVAGQCVGEDARDARACLADARSDLAKAAQHAGDQAFVDALRSDYSKQFLAPGDSSVRLWESAYVGKEGMVFQESTLDVRAFYHDAGFKLQVEKRFPDDHIAAMMDYMGRMAQRSYDAFADGDDDSVRTTLATQELFAERHLLTWVDDFAAKVRENDEHGVYAAFATMMAAFVRLDCDQAREIAAELGE